MSTPKDFLLTNLPLIKRLVVSIGRRAHMSQEEIEDLRSQVHLKLIEDDYAIVRGFHQRSSFQTFVAVVIGNLLLDERNHLQGKWHASAAANRLGEPAVTIERFVYRDQLSHDEAFAALEPKHPDLTRADFDRLLAVIPARTRRRNVPIDVAVSNLMSPMYALPPEQKEMAAKISDIVTKAIDRMPNDDQTILRLRFDSGMNVAQVARSLHINQQTLYRRCQRLEDALRGELEAAGVRRSDVTDLIGKDTELLDFRFESGDGRPSK